MANAVAQPRPEIARSLHLWNVREVRPVSSDGFEMYEAIATVAAVEVARDGLVT